MEAFEKKIKELQEQLKEYNVTSAQNNRLSQELEHMESEVTLIS